MKLNFCFIAIVLSATAAVGAEKTAEPNQQSNLSPVQCDYAPPGEYIKDHTIIFHDGWWHLYSISGTAGYYHGYTGNEETFSWSISKDLANWEFRGHVIHASNREGTFDQHEVWAPFVLKADDKFYMFYSGIVHPTRPMEYRKLGHGHPWVAKGHKETQGLACSADLTDWLKIADPVKGLEVAGRDSYVMRDEDNNRWLLYSTIGTKQANVSESQDLVHWKPLGICADFSNMDPNLDYGTTAKVMLGRNVQDWHSAESLNVIKNPVSGKWVMLGNWSYIVSDDPTNFKNNPVRIYDTEYSGQRVDIGFAGEMLHHDGKWYRSGCFGQSDCWKLGFTEVEWVPDEAFKIVTPSKMAKQD